MPDENVLIPPRPGLLSAIGVLHADVRGDFSLTRLVDAAAVNIPSLNAGFAGLKSRGAAWLRDEAASGAAQYHWMIEMRYVGQSFELSLDIKDGKLDSRLLSRLIERFHDRHREFYGYDMRDQSVEVVNLRLLVSVRRRTPAHEKRKFAAGAVKDALCDKRQVWFSETGFVTTPVYDRDKLPLASRIAGPAVIEQMDSTTVVPPGAKVKTDELGYLHIEVQAQQGRSAKSIDSREQARMLKEAGV